MSTEFIAALNPQAASIPPLPAPAGEDDAALVAVAKGGDNQAFEILVGRYRRRILALALRMTRNHEDAEDIVQLSLQKAFLHMHQFEGRSSFSTWLTRIAINEVLMWRRRNRASLELPLEKLTTDDGATLLLDPPDRRPSPEESCMQRERERILSAAMNTLTPGNRKAIELRELDELSTVETARVMGLSVSAVKSRMFHGRRYLREMLKGHVESVRERGSSSLRSRRKTAGRASSLSVAGNPGGQRGPWMQSGNGPKGGH